MGSEWLLLLWKESGAPIKTPMKAAQVWVLIQKYKCWERSKWGRKELRRLQNVQKKKKSGPRNVWWTGLSSKESSHPKKLSSEGFKICIDASWKSREWRSVSWGRVGGEREMRRRGRDQKSIGTRKWRTEMNRDGGDWRLQKAEEDGCEQGGRSLMGKQPRKPRAVQEGVGGKR